jgi:hypothetical protein
MKNSVNLGVILLLAGIGMGAFTLNVLRPNEVSVVLLAISVGLVLLGLLQCRGSTG